MTVDEEEAALELTGREVGSDHAADDDVNVSISNTKRAAIYQKFDHWKNDVHSSYILPRHYKLLTEEETRKYSLWSVNFMIICSAINKKMLNPNYAIMCTPESQSGNPASFPDTEPFGFNSATYFLPFCTLIGSALSNIFVGALSDRLGRKTIMLVLGWISTIGSVAKYYTRHTFWSFCISNLIFGFFMGTLPIGLAYIGDVEHDRKKKNELLGNLIGYSLLGMAGGGIIAVLMADVGLFAPLLVGALLMVMSTILGHIYMIEPAKDNHIVAPLNFENKKLTLNSEDEEAKRPDTIDKKTFWTIVCGALLDNIGSNALFPLCLSPLAFETYYANFVARNEDAVMSILGYQWLCVCVALLIVPSMLLTPWFLERMGVAGTCVFGNACTAVLTGLLLMIATVFPATTISFGFFVAVMYGGVAFTVFSQLTTGPMLDAIAPEDKVGFVQGVNSSTMNICCAIVPWLFGILADAVSTNAAIITGICVSVLAAVVNAPLMWNPLMNKQVPKPPPQKRILKGEDEEIVQKLLRGSFVDPELQLQVAKLRAENGLPAVVPQVRAYAEDKENNLGELSREASAAFKFRRDVADRILASLASGKQDSDGLKFSREELVQFANTMRGDDQDQIIIDQATSDLGTWVGEYLADNGYSPHTTSVLMKQMLMIAFPPLINGPEVTEENVEEYLIRQRRLMDGYVEQKKKTALLGNLSMYPGEVHPKGWW